ncbi:hypothetical protein F0562_026593 [Nyssa sinensis]|uniref:Uncharacterized protein n=1 Tax=Nyssa sinensis TaxID=561372 RepID=A0A5J5BFH2_9ASTE|nr:hypothetical protein F0562_026593 [Nyssa sinensis]
MDTKKVSDQSGCWTNERHLHFLNAMEASFVRAMFENSGRFLPLDRYLPDSSESTIDFKEGRRRRHSASEIMENRTEKKPRGLSSQPYTASQDQVVPQLGNRMGDKDKSYHSSFGPAN